MNDFLFCILAVFQSISWRLSRSNTLAFLLNYLLFFEGEILVSGCLVFLEKNVEKIIAQKGSSHDTDVRKLWEILGQMGVIPEKSHTGIMRVGGWGYGIFRGVIQEYINSISKFQGFIKKGVEFPGIKKNSCGICMGAWLLALDFGISKQQCNTILWNFQSWSFALSEISMGKVTISQGFFQIHNQE